MSSPFGTNNPGVGGLDELTSQEEALIASIASLGTPGQILVVNGAGDGLVYATASGTGDMLIATYDPNGVGDDAFDMDNMAEGTTSKILTAGERTKLSNITVTTAVDLDEFETSTELDARANLKVNISDIVDNLTSDLTNVPLSAAQGKALKGLIDTINSLLTSDETDLDTLQEIVDFIELNRSDLDSLTIASIAGLQTALDNKQATLVSGTNIKTINGTTVLGSGNIVTPNTTYTEITEAEITTGTASTLRTITARRLKFATDAVLSTVAGIYATLTTAQTLTNKTLTDAKLQTATNAQTGTTYTLVLTDASKHITMDNASANTLTVPPNASVAFAIGTRLMVQQLGAGATTIAAGAGVTINAPSTVTLAIDEQYESRGLLKTATNTWQLI